MRVENSRSIDWFIVDKTKIVPPTGKEEKYYDKLVAIYSLRNPVVLAFDNDLAAVIEQLTKIGNPQSFIFYVPPPGEETAYKHA